jgi:hypothetical protein
VYEDGEPELSDERDDELQKDEKEASEVDEDMEEAEPVVRWVLRISTSDDGLFSLSFVSGVELLEAGLSCTFCSSISSS